MDDPTLALLATFHSAATQRLSDAAGAHFSGLRQAGARMRDDLPRGLVKKLVHVDIAFAVVRHTTKAYLVDLLKDIDMALASASKEKDSKSVSVDAAAREGPGNAQLQQQPQPRIEATAEVDVPTSPCCTDEAATEPDNGQDGHAGQDLAELDHAERPVKRSKGDPHAAYFEAAVQSLLEDFETKAQSYYEQLTVMRARIDGLVESGKCSRAERLELEDHVNLLEADVLTKMSQLKNDALGNLEHFSKFLPAETMSAYHSKMKSISQRIGMSQRTSRPPVSTKSKRPHHHTAKKKH